MECHCGADGVAYEEVLRAEAMFVLQDAEGGKDVVDVVWMSCITEFVV